MTSTSRVLVAHPSADMYGSDRVLLESVEGLVARGCDVVVTLPVTGPLVGEVASRGATVVVLASPVLRRSLLSPRGLLSLAVRAARDAVTGMRLIRRVDPDIVLVNTVAVPLWPLLGRLSRRQVVVHVHEAEGSTARPVRRVLNLPLLLAHRVVVNSRVTLDVVVDSWPSLRRRCSVVLNGVPGPVEAVAPRASLDGGVRLLYVGRLSPRKGVDIAVQAVEELRERGIAASLDIVGAVFPGNEWFETSLREAADTSQGRVRLHGFADQVWPLLAAADVALVPSRQDESFGNTAVEAVLAMRPVVVSAINGLLEATSDYPTARAVDPGSAAAIADAVEGLVAEWPQVRDQVAASRAVAERKHAPQAYHRHVSEVVVQPVRRCS